jgi:PIN domain nuclease of toxin-antitoxin system
VASLIYLDTHVVGWLYAGRRSLLSRKVSRLLETSDLLISPMVVLELYLLYETGRTSTSGEVVVQDLQQRIGLRICEAPFPQVVLAGIAHSWARDPFDRLIVGQAALSDRPLVTKDENIRSHYRRAVW